jgi:S-adenosylmethionine synthetase
MAARSFSFTSESVTEGHPDKMADQIFGLRARRDPHGRSRRQGRLRDADHDGTRRRRRQITTDTYVDIRAVVRDRIAEIGYTRAKYGFDFETCGVAVAIDEQSTDDRAGRRRVVRRRHGDTDALDARRATRG